MLEYSVMAKINLPFIIKDINGCFIHDFLNENQKKKLIKDVKWILKLFVKFEVCIQLR